MQPAPAAREVPTLAALPVTPALHLLTDLSAGRTAPPVSTGSLNPAPVSLAGANAQFALAGVAPSAHSALRATTYWEPLAFSAQPPVRLAQVGTLPSVRHVQTAIRLQMDQSAGRLAVAANTGGRVITRASPATSLVVGSVQAQATKTAGRSRLNALQGLKCTRTKSAGERA